MRVAILFVVVSLAVLLTGEVLGQHPLKGDSDGDGIPDEWEVKYGLDPEDADDANLDYNHNGLTNYEEYRRGYDPLDKDTDDDGISNWGETSGIFGFRTDPLSKDTDRDGLDDLTEIIPYIDTGNETQMREIKPYEEDRDDVRWDIAKRAHEVYRTDPTNSDTDGDGLKDGDEVKRKSNPTAQDSDKDGLSDGEEVFTHGTDPAKSDTDGDGLTDAEEVYGTYGVRTDPTKSDTDGDGIPDNEEVLGIENVPIPPSKYILSFDEFTSSDAYTNMTITLKAKVVEIRRRSSKNYSIILKSPNESYELGVIKRVIAKVESPSHYDTYHDAHVDERFKIALKEGDIIFVVGVAGPLRGGIREISVGKDGAIYLVLSPEDYGRRWQPSMKYVKMMPKKRRTDTKATPTPTETPTPADTPTPQVTAVSPSPSPELLLHINHRRHRRTRPSPSPNASSNATSENMLGQLQQFVPIIFVVAAVSIAFVLLIGRRRKRGKGEAREAKEDRADIEECEEEEEVEC